MYNEDPCLHFEAKLVPDLRTKVKKRLIAAICDLKRPWYASSTMHVGISNVNISHVVGGGHD